MKKLATKLLYLAILSKYFALIFVNFSKKLLN